MKNIDEDFSPLFKETDDLIETINEYESWFESFIDSFVYIETKKKKKNQYITAMIIDFIPCKGWIARDDNDNLYDIDFKDFVNKKVILK